MAQLVEHLPSTQNVAGVLILLEAVHFFSLENKLLSSGVVVYFAFSRVYTYTCLHMHMYTLVH